ncbi:MAG: N-acetylmuramoyl-L-alanine amidase, partial [Oscillospiraceae bacterium]|nr:N-acetylmuramoyl-L-alanine amidase [Oscillospiraceae bacterium]
MTNAEKIYSKLISFGMTVSGACGLLGNLEAESALNPKNLQNTYEKSLGYTDESYTKAVDDGTYANFVKDCAGYGLAQWTYWARKKALLSYAKACKKSIGDLDMQLDFLLKELSESYPVVLKTLKTTGSIATASDCVMCQYERPANTSATAKTYRASLGQ